MSFSSRELVLGVSPLKPGAPRMDGVCSLCQTTPPMARIEPGHLAQLRSQLRVALRES